MKKVMFLGGLVLALAVVSAAAFGGFAAAQSQKASSVQTSAKSALTGSTAHATLGQYMAALQAKIPDPMQASPAHIRAVAKQVATQMGIPNPLIDLLCGWLIGRPCTVQASW